MQLINYQPALQPYFERFNKAWLEEYFTVEPIDQWVLENPEEAILVKGGRIYFAEHEGHIIGTVALRWLDNGEFELTKMAVDRNWRGRWAGKFLCAAAIQKAKELGVKRLILFSNRVLANAIGIYTSLEFTEIPVAPGTYQRADIMMEKIL